MLELEILPRTDRIPLEAEAICPDKLQGKSVAEIEALDLFLGNGTVRLGEFFRVRGDAGDGNLRLLGDCSTVKWIGAGMTSGNITVEGDAGMHVGADMTGGTIDVLGNASDWVGAEMKGGRIHVRGNAGHLIGACYRGGKVGMRGGVILVGGSVGNEIGAAMRRGLIAIGGAAGDYAGVGMIAGTILLLGENGIRLGAGMKRGTIAVLGPSSAKTSLLPTFAYDCEFQPTFLPFFGDQLRAWKFSAPLPEVRSMRRFNGDLLELGKGEILLA